MSRFQDVYLSSKIVGYPTRVAPRFSTDIAESDSGSEQSNQHWEHPLRSIIIPEGVRDHETFEALKDHWLIMRGPHYTFPFRDPTDFASVPLVKVNVAPTISRTDQNLSPAVADGNNRFFQLTKRYTRSGVNYDRVIRYPVVSSILIGVNGVDPLALSPALTATVDRESGVVEFDSPPPAAATMKWGGYFDLQVRFEADDVFDGIMRTYQVSGFADIPLKEVRYCP